MARKVEYISIMQLDAQSISALRFRVAGKLFAEPAYLRVVGDFAAPEAQAQALRDFIDEHQLRQDRVFVALPRYEVTTRMLTLPSHDDKEIAGMVRFSAEEYVPYTLDEVVIDQCILKTLDSGESEVLAALAHRDVVERHLSMLRETGLVPEQILLSTACIASAAIATHPPEPERYALVNLTAGGVEVTVISAGVLEFSRGIVMAQDWVEVARDPKAGSGMGVLDSGAVEELAAELRGSLAAYRRESVDGMGVDSIYVACAYADVNLLCQHLAETLGKTCAPANFALDLFEQPPETLPGIPLEAVGGALEARQRAQIRIHLLPEQESRARRLASTQRLVMRTAVCLAVIAATLGLYYYQAVAQRARMIDMLRQRITVIEPNARGITEKREQLNILRRQVDRKGSVVEQLAHLVAAAPDGRLNFTRLSLRRNEGIDLWGRAKTVNDVAQFTQNIRNMAEAHLHFFARARSLYEQQTMERNESVFTYQVEVSALEEEDDV